MAIPPLALFGGAELNVTRTHLLSFRPLRTAPGFRCVPELQTSHSYGVKSDYHRVEKHMRVITTTLLVSFLVASLLAETSRTHAQAAAKRSIPVRPVHTFSIVARDPNTGELGVAVQSHWFSVGPIVAWAEAGVGAVATQSFVDPSYG